MTDHPKVFRYDDHTIDFGRSNTCYVDDADLRAPRQYKRLASNALDHRDLKAQLTAEEAEHRTMVRKEKHEVRKQAKKVDQALTDLIQAEADVLSKKALRQLHRLLDKEEPTAAELKVILDSFLGTPTQRVEVKGDVSLTPIVISRKAPAIEGNFEEIESE